MFKVVSFIIILFFIACDNNNQVDVEVDDNVLEEKPKRPQANNKEESLIIVGTEEIQEDSSLGKINVLPLFTYKHKVGRANWVKVEEGLDYAEIDAPIRSNIADSKITVIRINPQNYEFQLLSSKENGEDIKPIDQWANEHELMVAINAGMFRADYATSTGYMKNFDFLNNPVLHKEYKTIIAFNPKTAELPLFQIIDLECQDWEELEGSYNSYVQCLRMLDCDRKNKWSKQEKYWSIAAISEDEDGNVLFLFSRTPYSVYDFNQIIRQLPIKATKMMYLEGGPEASIYLDYDQHQLQKMGSYETAFKQNDLNTEYWAIPNVLGVRKRRKAAEID